MAGRPQRRLCPRIGPLTIAGLLLMGGAHAGPGEVLSQPYATEMERQSALRDQLRKLGMGSGTSTAPTEGEREEISEIVADRRNDLALRADALRLLCDRGALVPENEKPAWARAVFRRGMAALRAPDEGLVIYEFVRGLRDHPWLRAWLRDPTRSGDLAWQMKESLVSLLTGPAERRRAVAGGALLVDVLRTAYANDPYVRMKMLEAIKEAVKRLPSERTEGGSLAQEEIPSEWVSDLLWMTDWGKLESEDRKSLMTSLIEIVRLRPDSEPLAQRLREALYVRLGDLAMKPETETPLRNVVIAFLDDQYRTVEKSPEETQNATEDSAASPVLTLNQQVVSAVLERLKPAPESDPSRVPASRP